MRDKKPDGILRFGPDLYTLQMLVGALNTSSYAFLVPTEGGWRKVRGDFTPVNRELRRLVQAWFDSGPNVSKLMSEETSFARLSPILRAYLMPTSGGRAHLVYMGGPDTGLAPGHPLDDAIGMFYLFLLNPYNEKLGGPCKQCGRYYVKHTKRQIVYCSKRCGLKRTSTAFLKKQRQQDRQQKVEKAKRSAKRWAATRIHQGWKEWVSSDTQISMNFLTRLVKSGELDAPVKSASQVRRSSS